MSKRSLTAPAWTPVAGRSRRLTACLLGLFALAGCSQYMGQVEVPGTGQRLVVGNDAWPFKKIWVIENGETQAVEVMRR